MHSPHVSKSTFTATITSTTTTVTVSKVSQLELAAEQRQQGSFVGLSATAHTPESTRISSTYYQQDDLGLLSEIDTTQTAPSEALATGLAVTFDGGSNEPSRSQKSSQPVDDAVPIVREEPSPDPTHKWIMKSGDKRRPFQCDHKGCGKKYTKRALLRAHLIRHIRDSQYRCYAGDCAGTIRYRDKRGLARHIQSNHSLEKPYQCEICKQWYRRADYLKHHRKRVHSIEVEKESTKRRSISKSSSATTTTANTADTSTITSGNSQSESAAGQHQQGSFVGLSTTTHTPEATRISSTYHQQDELRLLSDISVSDINALQTNPFEVFATHITATFDGDHQGQSASSLSLSSEPSRSQRSSQSVDEVVPIVREEPSPDPTDKWIMMSGDNQKLFKCGHKGCGRKYATKEYLQTHLLTHTGDSKLRCYLGDCSGRIIYRDVRILNQHIHANHTFKKPFGCEFCNRRFRRDHQLKYHREHVHFIKSKKRSPIRHSVSKSSSAATTIITTSTSTMTSRVSQPELAAGQRQQGSFADLSKTVHMPEPTLIPATYYQQDELGLLSGICVSDISSSKVDPFETLATHQSVTFEDQSQFQEQEQPDEFPLPFDELLQPVDDFDPMASEDLDDVNLSILPNKNDERISNRTTISIPEHEILPSINNHFQRALTGIRPEAVGITGYPKLPSIQHQAYKRPETDKWIILTGDKKRPFKCGYEGCDKRYNRKHGLRLHFVKHTGDSPYRCYMGACNGGIAFRRRQELTWHIRSKHTFERPYQCEVCSRRFIHSHHLRAHRRRVHSIENEKKLPKRKKK